MSTNIKNQLVSELNEILSEDSAMEIGRKAHLIDMVFAHRLILGRMPDANSELINLAEISTTWREFINSLLDSEEFAERLDLLPSGLRLMSDVNGFRFWFDSMDREMGVKMAAGIYEFETCSTIRKLVKPGMVCLDIGAQTGFYTCMMAQLVGTEGKVIAFEPIDRSFELLKRNIEENGWHEKVTLHHSGCSDTSGTMRVGVASGMIVADTNGSISINTIKIDDVNLPNADFCKIDVEGHEPRVIKGMETLLTRTSPIILTEVNQYWLKQAGSSPSDYMDLLSDFGYKLYNLEESFCEIKTLESENELANINVLALPNHLCPQKLLDIEV